MSNHLETLIEALYTDIGAGKKIDDLKASEIEAIEQTIASLDTGSLRVAEKSAGKIVTHQWIKKAILLYFRIKKM